MKRIREKRPIVHCLTNHVTANDCANILLAAGASAIMADDPGECGEITGIADSVVLNLGTPSPEKVEALLISGKCANERGIPVVFDPVGVGSSRMRRDAAERLLGEVKLSIIRGNASEMRTLLHGTAARRGVDTDGDRDDASSDARELAEMTGAVVALTGAEDIITDGCTTISVRNGHQMMGSVTGSGCMLSALMGAFAAAAEGDMLTAALAAACAMGLAGEIAYERLSERDGNASYRGYMIDAIYNMDEIQLKRSARYEIQN